MRRAGWDLTRSQYRTNDRTQVRTVERITAALRRVPTTLVASEPMTITVRWGTAYLAGAGLVPLAVVIVVAVLR